MGWLNIDASPVCGVHKIHSGSVAGIGECDNQAVIVHDAEFEVSLRGGDGDRLPFLAWRSSFGHELGFL
jgi:hypothetical protein